MFKIGAHVSVAKSIDLAIDRALESGFNCFQIFTHAPRVWKAKEYSAEIIDKFKAKRLENKIQSVVVHAPYLPNMASPDAEIWQKSVKTVVNDLKNADKFGVDYYVIHPGSSKGQGSEYGIQRICESLDTIFSEYSPNLTFLFESTAGAGSVLGAKMSELGQMVKHAQKLGVKAGICIDTAHLFASGCELRTQAALDQLKAEIKTEIGADSLKVIHCNDSKEPFGSKRDRHEHIGAGTIGLQAFELMLQDPFYRDQNWILETPKDPEGSDVKNRQILQASYNLSL